MARLRTSVDFERVLRSSSRARTLHFAVHHVRGTPDHRPSSVATVADNGLSTKPAIVGASLVDNLPLKQLGVVVPKRHARRAVTRTLLKRQIYAAGERHAATLDPGMWVVRLRAPFDKTTFPSAASSALRLLARTELEALFRAAGTGVAR